MPIKLQIQLRFLLEKNCCSSKIVMTKTASRLGRGLGSLISGGTQNTQSNPPSASYGNLNQNGKEVVQHRVLLQRILMKLVQA